MPTAKESLLVFAAAPGRLFEFDRYLANRGWELRIRSDFKQLLADVVLLRPRYVLVSLEARHPNLSQIRNLLAQVYQITVIDFSEESSLDTDEQIQALKTSHGYRGPLTGPLFERYLETITARPATSVVPLHQGISELMRLFFSDQRTKITQPLVWTSRLRCFHVCAGKLNGFFLAAMGGEKALDDRMSEKISVAIRDILEGQGLEVKSLESFEIDSRRVEFKPWAEKAARFVESGAHRGVEIALAFFETSLCVASLPVSSDGKYIRLGLEQVKPDRTVNFDLYLSLPMNGRYVLYVAAGSSLSLTQQLNLQSRRVDGLYARVRDRAAVGRDLLMAEVDRSLGNYYERRFDVA